MTGFFGSLLFRSAFCGGIDALAALSGMGFIGAALIGAFGSIDEADSALDLIESTTSSIVSSRGFEWRRVWPDRV